MTSLPTSGIIRQSNIELLRIVLMLMIILHHLLVHAGGLSSLSEGRYQWSDHSALLLTLNALVLVAVNTFVFISGYFGIKFKLKTLVTIGVQAIGYAVGLHLVFYFLSPEASFSFAYFVPVSAGVWWYLSTYICLYFLAPFLNAGFQHLPLVYTRFLLIGLVAMDTFGGFYFGSLLANRGYSLIHFITLYSLAHYLRKADIVWSFSLSILIYATGAILLSAAVNTAIHFQKQPLAWLLFSYNNPLLVVMSVAFFFIFYALTIRQAQINQVAGWVLGVYLFHDDGVMRLQIASFVKQYVYQHSGIMLLPLLFLSALVIFIIGAFVEKVRTTLFKPVLQKMFGMPAFVRMEKGLESHASD